VLAVSSICFTPGLMLKPALTGSGSSEK